MGLCLDSKDLRVYVEPYLEFSAYATVAFGEPCPCGRDEAATARVAPTF